MGISRKVGILGGTALRKLEGLKVTREFLFDTKFFGEVWVIEGTLEGREVVLIPRHGRFHEHLPSETNYVGNLVTLRLLGVTDVFAVSAMGGLAKGYDPMSLVFVDVTTDKTSGRHSTIFGDGVAGHIARPTAVCPELHSVLVKAAVSIGVPHKTHGDIVVINGPPFSSERESKINRREGHHVVGMTNEPEAKLARELGLHYAIIGQITDPDNPPTGTAHAVTQQEVTGTFAKMGTLASVVIREAFNHPRFMGTPTCSCSNALQGAILTDPRGIGPVGRERLCHIFQVEEIPPEWFAKH